MERWLEALISEFGEETDVGMALLGSHARGSAGPQSDVDLLRVLPAPPATSREKYSLYYRDGRLISVAATTITEKEGQLENALDSLWAAPGLRQMQILRDPAGALSVLKRKAEALNLAEQQSDSDRLASEILRGVVEEVHKELNALAQGDEEMAANALYGLTLWLARAMALHTRTPLSTENRWLGEVQTAAGRDSAWSVRLRSALGLEPEAGAPVLGRARSGLLLYLETARRLDSALLAADRETVAEACRRIETALDVQRPALRLPVYLDYNATTPVDPAVVEAMLPYLTEHFGNPASSHAYGGRAAAAMARARDQVAGLLGASPGEIIFTSCASESINQAIKGVAFARRRGHIITTVVEHPATLNACRYLEREFGFAVTVLPVGRDGRISPAEVEQAIRSDTILISVMHAQNETGTLQPIKEIGAVTRAHGILFHVDAAQTLGKIPVSVAELGCDLLTVAGHKIYAPKGVGALYVRQGVELHPLIHGASYEGGRRAGTGNVPYAVALGRACELAAEKLATGETERLRSLRDQLQQRLTVELPIQVNGHPVERLPNTLNISIPGVIGNDLLDAVPEIAASTGSACHAGVHKPNETLLAMGASVEASLGVLRLSVGRYTTAEEIDFAAERLVAAASAKRVT